MTSDDDSFDLLVVGAGPGGIAAAVTAAEAGRRVGLLDYGTSVGGQIWRNDYPHSKTSQAAHWFNRFTAAYRIDWRPQSCVVAKVGPSTLLVNTGDRPRMLSWKSLIIATGARELFLPFPGWTLPGVVGAGAIQALMKQGLDVRGKRVIVAGTGPLLLAVADLLRRRGANVPVILEQAAGRKVNRFALSLLRSPSKLLNALSLRRRLIGTAYATDSYPTSVEPIDSGVRVHFRRGGRDGAIDGDLLACGFNLIPNNELPSLLGCELTNGGFARVDDKLRTTVKNVFAVGEVTGIGGADKAIIEGQIASLTAMNAVVPPSLRRAHAAALAFSHRLQSAFALRPELRDLALPETIICRCEDVSRAAVEDSIGLRDAKLQTRCGMGPCQGRVCAPIMQHLFGRELPRVRPPLFPTSVGTLMKTLIES